MRYVIKMIFGTLALVVGLAGPLTAKTLTGKWGGRSATSLEFLENNKVKYCYKSKCTVQPFTGDKNQKIKFSWGRSKFTFTKTETGYDGTFLRVTRTTVKLQ